ncbi:YlbL family protein [Tessaracoccus sp. Z1128]
MSRNAVAIVSSLLFVALAALLVVLPVPYVAWRPGQTIDVLGSAEDVPVIEVSGLPTFETDGSLLMTTVSTTRADSSLSLPEAVFVYLSNDSDAMPREVIYPPGKTTDQVRNEAVAMMDKSRINATVAALRAAGVAVTELPRVESVVLSGPSADRLEPGDLLTAVDDIAMKTREDVIAQVGTHAVGDVIVFTVLRDGQEVTVSVTASASPTDSRRAVVGVSLDTGYRYSPQIQFGVDQSVTGPSAGLVFALGLYERITEGHLINDAVVAGTGEIDPNGRVTKIGAVREKIKGAERDGGTVFLVPEGNCADVGNLDTDVLLVTVSTLKDAIAALQLINEGNTAEVPTCG